MALREKLNWYERLPLFGEKIIITRAREQSAGLVSCLHELGAETICWPAIRIEPLPWKLDSISVYDWAIFTSVNGVRYWFDRITDVRELTARICAIGPATRSSIEAMRLKVDLIGDEFVAESLLAAFEAHDLMGKRILIARAEKARDVLPEGLRQRGAAKWTSCPSTGPWPQPVPISTHPGRFEHRLLDHLHQFLHRHEHRQSPGHRRTSQDPKIA